MCGEVKSKKDDKTASTPLVTVSDLQRMKENDVIIMRLRMNPFKTTFTPDYKINWGKKYPQAKYPRRKKREVHTFDIKEFVKSEKKRKLLEMMNQADDEPVKTPPFNSNPLFNKMMNQPDFNNVPPKNVPFGIPKEPEKKDDDEFNVDELVKKIDAKIAELEEEERRNNKEKEEKKENEKIEVIGDEDKEVIQNIEKKQPEITLDDEDDDDDDDFFDDFFDN